MVRHFGIEEHGYEEDYRVVGQNSTGSAFGYVPKGRRCPLYLKFVGLTATNAKGNNHGNGRVSMSHHLHYTELARLLSLVPCW